jgi:hypothetical protein
MPCEEFNRKELALQPIALGTSGNEVAEGMRTAVRQGVHMVESCSRELERLGAIDAAPAAITHRGALDRVFVVGCRQPAWTTGMRRCMWTKDSVIMPSGQFHLA